MRSKVDRENFGNSVLITMRTIRIVVSPLVIDATSAGNLVVNRS
jgi:hypothetical protein